MARNLNGPATPAPDRLTLVPAQLKFHPLAALFPLLEGPDFDRLVEDIKLYGLVDLITLHPDGSILDGRNRYRACLEAGREPVFVKWTGKAGTELNFVISKNVRRDHSQSRRAMAAARIANLPVGRHAQGCASVSQTDAGRRLGIGRRIVQSAAFVLARGTEKLIKAVDQERVTVTDAESVIRKGLSPQNIDMALDNRLGDYRGRKRRIKLESLILPGMGGDPDDPEPKAPTLAELMVMARNVREIPHLRAAFRREHHEWVVRQRVQRLLKDFEGLGHRIRLIVERERVLLDAGQRRGLRCLWDVILDIAEDPPARP